MATPLQAGQYVQTDKDNNPVVPQPGDTEITDAFGNVFDNFNTDWVDYKADNTAVSPQPAYQNLDYVQYTVENVAVSPPWEPDAGQWVAKTKDNVTRTPQPYVRSPLFPGGIPVDRSVPTIEVVLTLEDNEALVVTEDDINTIELVNVLTIPQVVAFIRNQGS